MFLVPLFTKHKVYTNNWASWFESWLYAKVLNLVNFQGFILHFESMFVLYVYQYNHIVMFSFTAMVQVDLWIRNLLKILQWPWLLSNAQPQDRTDDSAKSLLQTNMTRNSHYHSIPVTKVKNKIIIHVIDFTQQHVGLNEVKANQLSTFRIQSQSISTSISKIFRYIYYLTDMTISPVT